MNHRIVEVLQYDTHVSVLPVPFNAKMLVRWWTNTDINSSSVKYDFKYGKGNS
jgi:hypothetical protein